MLETGLLGGFYFKVRPARVPQSTCCDGSHSRVVHAAAVGYPVPNKPHTATPQHHGSAHTLRLPPPSLLPSSLPSPNCSTTAWPPM